MFRADPHNESVLILGGSFLQAPMILAAKKLGLHTIVADRDSEAVAVSLADEFYLASTIDLDAIRAVVARVRPTGITTMATDMPMRVVAAICEEFALPGISSDTAFACTDKSAMIHSLAIAGVPHPVFRVTSDLAAAQTHVEEIGLPCIIKPVDSSGSRGVVLLESLEQLPEAFGYALSFSLCGKVLIEEYLRGPEVSCEVFNDGETVHVLAVTDKCTTGAPHFVETGHSQPSLLSDETLQEVRKVARKAVHALGITVGPAHVEIIVTEDGPVIVELGARLGGDCITSHLVPLSTGIDLMSLVLMQAVGRDIQVPTEIIRASAVRFIEFPPGKLTTVSGVEEARKVPNVVEVAITRAIGDCSAGTYSSTDRLGYVIAAANELEDAVAACDKAVSLVKIEVN